MCRERCCWRRIVYLLPLSWQRGGWTGLQRLATITRLCSTSYECVTLPWAMAHVSFACWVGGTNHKQITINLTCFFRHVRTCPTARERIFSDGFTSLLTPPQTSPLMASLLQSWAFFRICLSFFISLYGVLYVHMDGEQMSSHICVKMSYFLLYDNTIVSGITEASHFLIFWLPVYVPLPGPPGGFRPSMTDSPSVL